MLAALCSHVCSVPPPDGAVITHPHQRAPVPGPRGLSHRGGALGVSELHRPDLPGLIYLEVPHVDPPRLVAQGQQPLAGVQAEPHEPDVAVPDVQLVDDHALVLAQLVPCDTRPLLQPPGLPADDLVLAGLGEDELPKPAAAVHIVPVDVPGGEVGEMAELGGESFLCLHCVVAVRGLNRFLDLLSVKPK